MILDLIKDTTDFSLDLSMMYDIEDIETFLKEKILIFKNKKADWKYLVPGKRVYEILEWNKYKKWDMVVTPRAEEVIVQNPFYQKTAKFLRGHKFDESLISTEYKPYPHQFIGIDFLINRLRSYLADDAGLGKTLQIIAANTYWLNKELIDSIFLVVRSGAMHHWFREFNEISKLINKDDIQVIENVNKKDIFGNYKNKKVLIVPPHLLRDIITYYKGKPKSKNPRWSTYKIPIKDLWEKENISLIADEAHDFKNSSSQQSTLLETNKNNFDYRILASATPGIINFADFYQQCRILDDSIIPMSEEAFKIKVSEEIGNHFSTYAIKKFNPEEVLNLRNNMKFYFIQRMKKDIPEMKAKQFEIPVYVKMNPIQKEIYDILYEDDLKKLEASKTKGRLRIEDIKVKFNYTVQSIDNPLLLNGKIENEHVKKLLNKYKFDEDPRLPYLDAKLKDIIELQGGKAIIFDPHPETLELLYKRYEKYNPLIIHGGTKDNSESKQRKEDLFNDPNSKHKLIILSTIVASASINLYKGSNRVFVFTMPNGLQYRQLKDRTHRIVSVKDTIIEIFVIDETYDVLRYETNMKKVELNDDFFNRDFDLEELQELMHGAKVA